MDRLLVWPDRHQRFLRARRVCQESARLFPRPPPLYPWGAPRSSCCEILSQSRPESGSPGSERPLICAVMEPFLGLLCLPAVKTRNVPIYSWALIDMYRKQFIDVHWRTYFAFVKLRVVQPGRSLQSTFLPEITAKGSSFTIACIHF